MKRVFTIIILIILFFDHLNKKIDQKTDDFTSNYHHRKITLFLLSITFTAGALLFASNIFIGVLEIFKPNNYPWFIIPGFILSPIPFWFSYHGMRNSVWRLAH